MELINNTAKTLKDDLFVEIKQGSTIELRGLNLDKVWENIIKGLE